jgi:glucokinase
MILAGDFGGTIVKLGLLENGRVQAQSRIPSPARSSSQDWMPALKLHADELCKSVGVRLAELEGMVWALPMVIAPCQRRASWSFGKFDDAKQSDFHTTIESLFGLPIALENDARAAAIGEWQAGAGRGLNDLVMITLGTGIGTAVIHEGRPLRGRGGMAGNLGGLSISHLGTPVTGKVAPGCIEGLVSTWALPIRAAQMPGFAESPLASASPLDYRAVFTHAADGDPLASQLRDEALEAWAALTVNLIQHFDPERVILGGGIMASGEVILPKLRDFVDRYAVQGSGPVDLVAAELGDHAALFGCEWIWRNGNYSRS